MRSDHIYAAFMIRNQACSNARSSAKCGCVLDRVRGCTNEDGEWRGWREWLVARAAKAVVPNDGNSVHISIRQVSPRFECSLHTLVHVDAGVCLESTRWTEVDLPAASGESTTPIAGLLHARVAGT